MPSLEDFSPSPSPRKEPGNYPGHSPDQNYLLADAWIYLLAARPRRRVGQWAIDPTGGPLAARISAKLSVTHLSQALLAANVAPMDDRYPVVAIGSNAAPRQLHAKFEDVVGSGKVVPVTRARILGLRLAHSGHVSKPGYLPYIAVDEKNATKELHASVLWLDSYQLGHLNHTEPNYDLVSLSSDDYSLTLDSGDVVANYGLYRGKYGALHLEGEPLALGVEGGQEAAFARLSELSWFSELVGRAPLPELMARLSENEALRVKVRQAIAERNLATDDGLRVSGDEIVIYGSSVFASNVGAATLVVAATVDADFTRNGEQCAVFDELPPSLPRDLTHVIVSNPESAESPEVLARVARAKNGYKNLVGLDQTIRDGIGVELGESVACRPAEVHQRFFANLMLGKPEYVLCRVQRAGVPIIEQQVCMIAPLVLEMIGTSSGDEIVIEGLPTGTDIVPVLRLKAFGTPPDVTEERLALSGGGLRSRYPSAQDALGVYPDLPWIFLDQSARSALGVDKSKLSVVRVRASRAYQLNKEIREALLLLALAFVGLISALKAPWAIGLTTALLVITALAVIYRRLKRRLSRRFVVERRT